MSKKTSVGIDLGTYHTKVMVLESALENGKTATKILGTGTAESKGLRHGYIINKTEASKSIQNAVGLAEKMSGLSISKAYVSIGGIGLSSVSSNGATIISRADSEITELDVDKAIETSKSQIPAHYAVNRKILHRIPNMYKIDGKPIVGLRPTGMKGSKLEVKTLFVSAIEQHLEDLTEAVEEAGVEVVDFVASPIAASIVTLKKTQKIAGVVLANIGAETVSIVVYENNIPVSLEVFPYGGTNITNDIALGLKIPLEEAEEIKRGGVVGANYPRRKLEDIVCSRLKDIFELIDGHLRKLGRNSLLPAGIVITGGSSKVASIEDLARASLGLPSRIATLNFGGNIKNINDSVWAVAYGLCLIGLRDDEDAKIGADFVKKAGNKILEWFKHYLP
ncbi:MAG: cell division protein FtsA [Candidatus Taylorbacteria bacterium RIFCSPLOWO2_12_FULL_47_20]|uniref:Cell division protein FtsA n=2 Tax=Candidatus Tayloriibacteriota TaxID=1817919 RepID=A0A1G2PC32_9BACT|nr:MAG: cell division protein FtsA [Candidatus Taylorbacteria bacterium RIFCSPLOWO2_02_FULL_46_40]OHA45141.1 MAG: cell division protein FtsA [Candidatus Taylorbacteria bacterium RIFCSPLOWO2_12_FULL_47_20]